MHPPVWLRSSHTTTPIRDAHAGIIVFFSAVFCYAYLSFKGKQKKAPTAPQAGAKQEEKPRSSSWFGGSQAKPSETTKLVGEKGSS